MIVSIIDGYIDEPTCLGVPPYISPYPRYIAGAILDFDRSIKINYYTIDQIRKDQTIIDFLEKSDIVVTVAGMSVPGRYLSGFPASPNEVKDIMSRLSKPIKLLSGPAARYGFGIAGGKRTRYIEDVFDLVIKGDGEIVIYNLLKERLNVDKVDPSEKRKDAKQISFFAIKGSEIVKQHPFYPNYLIAEIETYRGCPRAIVGGCSFCIEPSKGLPDFRDREDIIREIQSLYKNGIKHFRLGNQPCIFSYLAKDAGREEFPRPNVEAIRSLFEGIRKSVPDLKTLHIDNANPGVIARFPEEARSIAKIIVKYHTPGDVAALGLESADPVVAKMNNLKASAEETMKAIEILNEVGAKKGSNGMPELLPGLNFVFGLYGETKETFEINYDFLKEIISRGLLLRRINLRQVIPLPGTRIEKLGTRLVSKHKNYFKRFKNKVREEIERPMLKKMLPVGSVLRDVYKEKVEGKLTFGRQIGSYPLLIGIPGIQNLNEFIDVKVVDYGFRSITAVPYPLDINKAPRETIEALPAIGKKRAVRILANRPFKSKEDLFKAIDDRDVVNEIIDFLSFDS